MPIYTAAAVDHPGPAVNLVVQADNLRVIVEGFDGSVDMHTTSGQLSSFQRFTASQAIEIGVALQRAGEEILRAG